MARRRSGGEGAAALRRTTDGSLNACRMTILRYSAVTLCPTPQQVHEGCWHRRPRHAADSIAIRPGPPRRAHGASFLWCIFPLPPVESDACAYDHSACQGCFVGSPRSFTTAFASSPGMPGSDAALYRRAYAVQPKGLIDVSMFGRIGGWLSGGAAPTVRCGPPGLSRVAPDC